MTTIALHRSVQRNRFFHHARQAVTGWLRPAVAANSRAPDAALRDAVREAQNVREMALSFSHSDPRFAADLFAAADRHEHPHVR